MQRITQTYNVNVRVGNWVEETFLQSEKIKSFLEKRDKGELLIQKTRKMYASLLKPVVLNGASEFLRYGEDTQLVCPDVRFPGSTTSGVSLSCTVGEQHLESDGLGPGCSMTASSFTEPCVRNCFKICGIGSDNEDGKPLKFGDTFAISPCISSKPLFVTVVMPRLCAEQGMSDHPVLRLTDSLDAYCRWRVTYWNAGLMMEVEGLPIPNGARVILNHIATNQNAAVETDFRMDTFFGNEYEVSAHSYKERGGPNKAQNLWQFITGRSNANEKIEK